MDIRYKGRKKCSERKIRMIRINQIKIPYQNQGQEYEILKNISDYSLRVSKEKRIIEAKEKVVKIIQSYVGIVDRMVWRKY